MQKQVFGVALVLLLSGAAPAQETYVFRQIQNPVKHDISPPLRDIAPKGPATAGPKHEIPLGDIPVPKESNAPDTVIQSTPTAPATATASPGWDGLGVGFPGYSVNVAPPDPNIAVGPNHIVQWVNLSYVVFDKSGTALSGIIPGNAIWSGFGGLCESHNDGDPIVQYDRAADRWLMSQLAYGGIFGPDLQCFAVSTSPDPLGSYNRYAYDFGSSLNDYPKITVWPDGYYATYNMFRNSMSFSGGRVCAYQRDQMLAGGPATSVCFQFNKSIGGLLSSDLDGANAPPAGAPNYVMNFGTDSLRLWKFHVDWANPNNSTLTGPTTIAVSPFSIPCGGSRNCIPQPTPGEGLDALGDRLMYRLAYRNLGSYQSLVVNHSVSANGVVGVRWYEVRNPDGTPTLAQQGTFAPAGGEYRWMGSIAMDKSGNIGLGYSVSSSSGTKPSLRFTGHETSDPPGEMQTESILATGTGVQTNTSNRWGDYSAMRVDPKDDCTFWYTGEYQKSTGSFNWSTRIGSLKFASCGGTTTRTDTTTTITNDLSSATVTGQGYTVNFSVIPAAATGTVTVSDGTDSCMGTLSSSGTGSCLLTSTTAGSKNLTAAYAGDASYNPSTSPTAPHTVNMANTTTTISAASPNPSTVGQAYTVTFSVAAAAPGTGTPTGSVTVSDQTGATCVGTLSGGSGSCSLTSTTEGTKSLVASYGSDSNFNASTSAGFTHTVNPAPAISLSASGYKVKGLQKADLSWSGATGNVDVFRDAAPIATNVGGTTYTDNIDNRGSGSYVYQVCNAGTATCSNTATVSF